MSALTEPASGQTLDSALDSLVAEYLRVIAS